MPLDLCSVKTLSDVLKKSAPSPDDHESRMLHRMRRLVAQSKHMVALVRVREGIYISIISYDLTMQAVNG